MEGNTADDLILSAIEQLNPFYPVERTSINGYEFSAEFKAKYLAMETSVKSVWKSEVNEKEERIHSPKFSSQWLAEILGLEGFVWVIDDFHRVCIQERQKFAEIFDIFNSKSNVYPLAKIIATGDVVSGQELVKFGGNLANCISEIKVPLMTNDEIRNIINNGERLLNIKFSRHIHEIITQLSINQPANCHNFCFNICYEYGITQTQNSKKEITPSLVNDIIIAYLLRYPDRYKDIFEQALKKINLN
jgi:hypothetical protein